MKLAIMQPYFFPYLGHFQLINAVDRWVVFDVVQYIERGWMNRNRILSPNIEKEWSYAVVPTVNHDRSEIISNVKIDNAVRWEQTILGQLSYYKKIRAPYYNEVIELFTDLTSTRIDLISELNVQTLKRSCEYIGIKFNYEMCSNLHLDFSSVKDPGDWALEIARQTGASTYINPSGGTGLFNKEQFHKSNIEIQFLKSKEISYKQSKRTFVPWLSILDVMMFNAKDEISKMLNQYELV
jgi:WbqC-like protein family